ncbi:MAG: hypothetical protein FJX72_14545 [Armatimonadetes bacterium]|nr:hypothetical protein [Armatimonadota bacterium]
MRSIWRALDEMPDVAPPATLRSTIWQRIEAATAPAPSGSAQDDRGKRRRPVWARGLAYVGAALVVAALATVTVPGKYRPAAFTWALERLTGPRQSQVTLRAAYGAGNDHGRAVAVAVSAPRGAVARGSVARVEVLAGVRSVGSASLPTGGASTTSISVPTSVSGPLTVRLKWTEASGRQRSVTVPVR